MGISEVLLCPYHYLEYIIGKLEELKIQLPLLPVPDNSASQSYLSSCDAQCLSSLFLNEFTDWAVMTEQDRLFHTFVIHKLN